MFLPLAEDLNFMGAFRHSLATGQFPPAIVDWDQVDLLILVAWKRQTEILPEVLTIAKAHLLSSYSRKIPVLAKNADIILSVTAPGITSGGTATRLDGVALPLKQITESKNGAPLLPK